jgi:hypothetical protein
VKRPSGWPLHFNLSNERDAIAKRQIENLQMGVFLEFIHKAFDTMLVHPISSIYLGGADLTCPPFLVQS